ncbi:peptide-N(4)-(N-acetyl-beta-glucosaminyl)asparagine amidase-like [Clytia hemisphaerica]
MATATAVVEILSDINFSKELSQTPSEQLVVVDFYAEWCGPCKYVAPILAELSLKYKNVKFLKVDVDKCQATSVANGIEAMPTFLFFKNNTKIDSLRGADTKRLEQIIVTHMGKYITEPDPVRVATGRSYQCFEDLSKNEPSVFKETGGIILRYANNILRDPENMKYRQIRLENKIIMEKVLPTNGAFDTFFTMGFQEMDDKLFLPHGSNLEVVHQIRDALTDAFKNLDKDENNKTTPQTSSSAVSETASTVCSTSNTASCRSTLLESVPVPGKRKLRFNPAGLNNHKTQFFHSLSSHTNQVLLYEEEALQIIARSHIPLDELKTKAEKEYSKTKNLNSTSSYEDCLLLEMLTWFKNDFFSWMNSPKCTRCESETKSIGMLQPSPDDLKWGAGRVEGYQCKVCGTQVRFRRYNHPQKLLETRTGRCGEWANCFTLCCRAVGLEARYVLDWTDHVWTEVYSKSKKRWLHCDSCENSCDKPLTYEAGWGKELSYVVAFSKDEVIDVTWRYTNKFADVMKRRNKVPEKWIIDMCQSITKELRYGATEAERQEFTTRHIKEIVEFISPKGVKAEEQQGRQSGSTNWRSMRGEMGDPSKLGYSFKLSDEHKRNKRFRMRYNPVKDEYYTNTSEMIRSNEPATVEGWSNGLLAIENIHRKVEHDWKMVYLARTEGTNYANLQWRLDLKNSGFKVKRLTIVADMKCFETGQIVFNVSTDGIFKLCNQQSKQEGFTFSTSEFKGEDEHVTITAHLSGGKGDVAWQHTQLFRTSLDVSDYIGLEIDVELDEK